MSRTNDFCIWYYRPATTLYHHFAHTSCGDMKYLSTLTGTKSKPEKGVADWYNGRLCPQCGKEIKMDYSFIEGYECDELGRLFRKNA